MQLASPNLSALDTDGAALLPRVLSREECADIIALWEDRERFRKEVVMEAKGYGSGTYRYFDYPLPDLVTHLREQFYPALAEVANRWAKALDEAKTYPATHAQFIQHCHELGQTMATPLILKYGAGDWNALHQDIYGEGVFPLQMVILLSDPETDFTGGEFVLCEDLPDSQSRPHVFTPGQGDAVIFPVRERPVETPQGVHATQIRHGVSRVRSGERWTLGVIFHDAA